MRWHGQVLEIYGIHWWLIALIFIENYGIELTVIIVFSNG
jgi:hypothetical protein